MDFLRLLEGMRTPFFDKALAAVTYLGDEAVFMVAVIVVLWCVDKKWGFRLFFMGMAGSIVNQFLKAVFLVPRPWLLDENFTIVESARAGAGGYSFPSGHTQSVTTLFGGVAAWLRRWWVTVLCAALILLTAFSRMYLGVHTPADVLTSLGTGILTVTLLTLLFEKLEGKPGATVWIYISGVALALAFLLYVLLAKKTAANIAEYDASALKNGCTMLATMIALLIAWTVDGKWLHFEVKAVWWAQLIKLVVGLAIIIAIKVLLKAPLNALFHDSPIASGVRYFLMSITGGLIWPLTFKFFGRLGNKKTAE